MINLSKRLLAISKYIDNEDRIIDIGCDHALLDIYLVQSKHIDKIIASDIVKDAIDSARNNINKYNISNIDLRCGDGLKVLKDTDDINTIIISGMGYQKIIDILSSIKRLNNINKIIIQSNNYPSLIRKFITENGYYISNEELVKENNIIYTIIVFKKGNKKYKKWELEFGPCLTKEKNEIYYELLNNNINKNIEILKTIPKKYFLNRLKLRYKIKKYIKEKKS